MTNANGVVKVECNGCGEEFTADRSFRSGPCAFFDVASIYVTAFLGMTLTGVIRLDRDAADAGGPLAGRLAACRQGTGARGRCAACCVLLPSIRRSHERAGD
jgi:hypothetical protein